MSCEDAKGVEGASVEDEEEERDEVDVALSLNLEYVDDLSMPFEVRTSVYEHIPGVSVVREKSGAARSVVMTNYLAFASFVVRRFEIVNAEGIIFGWDGDERVVGDDEIIRLATRCGFDLLDTDKKAYDALRAIERRAPKVSLEEASHNIGFTNGVLSDIDWSFDPDPKGRPTLGTIPHEYHADRVVAPDGVLMSYLRRLSVDRADVMQLYGEVVGLCMSDSLKTREMPVAISRGQHGKSTFNKLLRHVVGEHLTSSLSAQELCDKFGKINLQGKKLNISDDEDVALLDGTGVRVLKQIASHEPTYADRKGIRGVNFRPIATMMLSSNGNFQTSIRDSNDGFWLRVVPIPFEASFVKSFDPDMEEKLASEDVIEDAIWYGIECLKAVKENRWRLTKLDASVAQAHEMQVANDNVLQWYEDEAECGLVGYTTSSAFESYYRWCQRANTRPMARNSFTAHVCETLDLHALRVRLDMRRSAVFSVDETNIPAAIYAYTFADDDKGRLRCSESMGTVQWNPKSGKWGAVVAFGHGTGVTSVNMGDDGDIKAVNSDNGSDTK